MSQRRRDPQKAAQHQRTWLEKKRQTEEGAQYLRDREYDRSLQRKYGISREDYDRMLAEQDGHCALCPATEETAGRLQVDHDHKNGRNRGLLCGNCNRGLARFGDDPNRLLAAAAYCMLSEEVFS